MVGVTAVGTRVIALRNIDTEKAYSFGEGVYLGDLIPNTDSLPGDFRNPCIQLDDGGFVWGFQCWWGPTDQITKQIGDRPVEKVDLVDSFAPKERVS